MMTSPERRIGWNRPLAVVLAATLVVVLAGCAKTRHVDAAEFLEKSKVPVGDVYLVRFVGVREGRAWLEEWSYWPVLGERTVRLWTEADGLAPDVLRNLEAKRVEYERWIAEERRRNLGG
jgi:hypothetical protein